MRKLTWGALPWPSHHYKMNPSNAQIACRMRTTFQWNFQEKTRWCCATSKKPGTIQLQLVCMKRIDNLYSVINELFCNSLIMLLRIAKEVLFKQTALNNKYCTQKYHLNCFIKLSTVNSLNKASGLPYIFIHVSTGHIPFQLKRIGYSW